MRSFFQLRATTIACVLCFVQLVASLLFELDLFEGFLVLLARFEALALDQIFLGLVLVLLGALWDLSVLRSRERRERAFERQRLKALQATMVNATGIVNLLVASVKLFRYEAEAAGQVSSTDIARLDAAILRTQDQLSALKNAKSVPELNTVGKEPARRTIPDAPG